MNGKTKYEIIVAMEECGEIIQACSKGIRFGLVESNPFENKTMAHRDEILTEYYQLQAIIEKLQKDGALPYYNKEQIENIKKNKIMKMIKYMNQARKNKKLGRK